MLSSATSLPIRVLHAVGGMDHGGVEHFLMNVYRKIDRNKVQFDFVYRVDKECVFDEEILSLGGRIYRCPSPDKNPVRSYSYYRKLFETHPEIQILHCHLSSWSGFLGLPRMAKRMGVPTILFHSHNSALPLYHGVLGNAFELLSDKVNRLIQRDLPTDRFACSKTAGEWLYSSTPGHYTIVPNGIDAGLYRYDQSAGKAIRKYYGISESDFVIGCVGRLSRQKNHRFLLDVIAEYPRESRPVLLLVGDGELRGELQEKASRMGIEESVVFAGAQKAVWQYYSAMNVLCMPSLYEGLPVSAVEAQANGLPIVFSTEVSREADLGGCCSFIPIDGSPGVWVEEIIGISKVPINRMQGNELVINAGYDISEVSERLMNYYLAASKGELQ